MNFRLYVDEVGNGDLKGAGHDANIRFLSLTGVMTTHKKHRDVIQPEIDQLKADLFGHTPDNPIILHRREIMRRQAPFQALRDAPTAAEFDRRILHLIRTMPYLVMTVVIDKKKHLELYGTWHFNPYHYCLQCLVERYILYLLSKGKRGDVVIEARSPNLDKLVKASFNRTYENGTDYIKPVNVQKTLISREIGLKVKKSNIAGIQLADMLAHPSERHMRFTRNNAVQPNDFGNTIAEILVERKYRRDPKTLKIDGYGRKWLP